MEQKGIFVILALVFFIGIVPISFADHHVMMSPRQQMENGVAAEDVVCKSGLSLMISPSGDAACVNEDSVKKLENRDWKLEKEASMEEEHEATETADLVLTNGKIFTVDEERSWQEAFAVKDGKLIKVGTNEDVESLIVDSTEVIDAEGQLILPGFHDLHMHPSVVANRFAGGCGLPQSADSPTIQTFLDAVEKCVKDNPDSEWVVGFGGPTALLDDVHARDELDKISPDRPLFIQDETGHNGWANSQAFELAGITKDTPDPPRSTWVKDDQGELQGKIIELSATEMIWKVVTPANIEQRKQLYSSVVESYNSMGFTGISNLKTIFGHQAIIAELDREGSLNAYAKMYHWSVNFAGEDAIIWADDILADLENYEFKNVDPMGAKIFMDGTFEGFTGALFEPYEGQPDNYGITTLSQEKMREIVFDLDAKGFQISVHAIGDKAVRNILDVFEELREERGDSMLRHRVTHAFLITPEDRNRFAEIGVGLDVELSAAAPIDLTWNQGEMIGEDRVRQMYPFGDVIKSGAVMGFGVDWPVGDPNPFPAIEISMTRTADDFPERGTLGENQEITVEAAVAVLTINGAWLQGFDEITGSIEEGKFADFIIVDKNIFEIPENEVSDVKVLQTYFQGNNVYDSNLPEQPDDYDELVETIQELVDDEDFIMAIP